MARGLCPHGILPQLSELIIARTRAHRRMKIDAVDAKQAGIDLSALRRVRVHEEQKGDVIDAITPMIPPG